jgi:hypothetical protein
MPLLSLDFIPCPSNEAAAAAPGGLEIERLKLYRLNASSYYNYMASPTPFFIL